MAKGIAIPRPPGEKIVAHEGRPASAIVHEIRSCLHLLEQRRVSFHERYDRDEIVDHLGYRSGPEILLAGARAVENGEKLLVQVFDILEVAIETRPMDPTKGAYCRN
jgi:hypothetical protein